MSNVYAGPRTTEFRVWHIPQIPMRAFIVDTDSLEEARHIMDVLAFYDLFQYQEKVKPDYSNASGILQWDPGDLRYFDLDDDEIQEKTPDYDESGWYSRIISANIERT